MASLSLLLLLSFFLFFSFSSAAAKPNALVLPIKKDTSTLQYTVTIDQRTPLLPLPLLVDLGGRFLWVACDPTYVSSTYLPALCHSSLCSLAHSIFCGDCPNPHRPGCTDNTCGLYVNNPYIPYDLSSTGGDLATDVLAFNSTDGFNPGPLASATNFPLSCSFDFELKNLANGTRGIAGFGRGPIGIPRQLANAFGFHPKFAMCLSGRSTGVMFFGDVSTYHFLFNVNASQSLTYTPLIVNPVTTVQILTKNEKSTEYFIGVKSIKIMDRVLSLNKTLLKIDKHGVGGAKISSVTPYTLLETSIYKALIRGFSDAIAGIPRVRPVGRFGLCYKSESLGSTRVGPGVPSIDLVLQKKSVVWRIFGANSLVEAKKGVLCLAFVDGGVNPRTSVVIGGYQLEDNLLEFDLAKSRLGFTSSLLFRQTTCGNFNFTSNA